MFNEALGKIAFFITFIGANWLFMTMFFVGLQGMPRRYFDYSHLLEFAPEITRLQVQQTYGAYIMGFGVLLILINWIHGLIAGEKAPDNPWGSRSLEWTHTPTPPGPGNFGGKIPELSEDWSPYGYGS
jgi:cytochrome c oxidase subunit 1